MGTKKKYNCKKKKIKSRKLKYVGGSDGDNSLEEDSSIGNVEKQLKAPTTKDSKEINLAKSINNANIQLNIFFKKLEFAEKYKTEHIIATYDIHNISIQEPYKFRKELYKTAYGTYEKHKKQKFTISIGLINQLVQSIIVVPNFLGFSKFGWGANLPDIFGLNKLGLQDTPNVLHKIYEKPTKKRQALFQQIVSFWSSLFSMKSSQIINKLNQLIKDHIISDLYKFIALRLCWEDRLQDFFLYKGVHTGEIEEFYVERNRANLTVYCKFNLNTECFANDSICEQIWEGDKIVRVLTPFIPIDFKDQNYSTIRRIGNAAARGLRFSEFSDIHPIFYKQDTINNSPHYNLNRAFENHHFLKKQVLLHSCDSLKGRAIVPLEEDGKNGIDITMNIIGLTLDMLINNTISKKKQTQFHIVTNKGRVGDDETSFVEFSSMLKQLKESLQKKLGVTALSSCIGMYFFGASFASFKTSALASIPISTFFMGIDSGEFINSLDNFKIKCITTNPNETFTIDNIMKDCSINVSNSAGEQITYSYLMPFIEQFSNNWIPLHFSPFKKNKYYLCSISNIGSIVNELDGTEPINKYGIMLAIEINNITGIKSLSQERGKITSSSSSDSTSDKEEVCTLEDVFELLNSEDDNTTKDKDKQIDKKKKQFFACSLLFKNTSSIPPDVLIEKAKLFYKKMTSSSDVFNEQIYSGTNDSENFYLKKLYQEFRAKMISADVSQTFDEIIKKPYSEVAGNLYAVAIFYMSEENNLVVDNYLEPVVFETKLSFKEFFTSSTKTKGEYTDNKGFYLFCRDTFPVLYNSFKKEKNKKDSEPTYKDLRESEHTKKLCEDLEIFKMYFSFKDYNNFSVNDEDIKKEQEILKKKKFEKYNKIVDEYTKTISTDISILQKEVQSSQKKTNDLKKQHLIKSNFKQIATKLKSLINAEKNPDSFQLREQYLSFPSFQFRNSWGRRQLRPRSVGLRDFSLSRRTRSKGFLRKKKTRRNKYNDSTNGDNESTSSVSISSITG